MKIQLLQEEFNKLNYKTEIKNINELYIQLKKSNILSTVDKLRKSKLSFVAEFCAEEEDFIIRVVFTHRELGYFVILAYSTKEEIISLQENIFQANIFERELADLFGVKIMGGKDIRNIVKHEPWEKQVYPLRKQFPYGLKIRNLNQTEEYAFKQLSGEGGYQIAVGPVHAGIIEPGHFRFSVIGEEIENLEIRLMYKHRGIEKICENIEAQSLNLVFERVAGESSVAYAEAYALLIEKLVEYKLPKEIKALRVVLLELERIYNFLDDIGGMCTDVGFSYPAKKFGFFSEQLHQLCERITGSRFLRNTLIPCGINIDFDKNKAQDISKTLSGMKERMNQIIHHSLNSVSFLDRVENTGIVDNNIARSLCLTGVVGRASKISYDVRKSFPYEIYKDIKTKANIESIGGVFERYKLKVTEIQDAFIFIEKALALINKDIVKERPEIILEQNREALVTVETAKGELMIYGKTASNNRFSRVYFKTPSFTNWKGLTYAVLKEIVPDFPLCNKSFNMSYSENDR